MRSILQLKFSATKGPSSDLKSSKLDQDCREKVLGWKGELEALSEIANSQSHSAYTVFTKGYKSKFTYFMRTIESFEDYVKPYSRGDRRLTSPNTIWLNGAPP